MRPRFYRDVSTGDFVAIFPDHHSYDPNGQRVFEGRGTAIEGLVTSVCTLRVGETFLEEDCIRVTPRDVPRRWRHALLGV